MRLGSTGLRDSESVRSPAAMLAIVLLAVAPYLQTLGFSFLAWDDDRNVYANPWLLSGHWWQFWTQPYYGLYVPLPYTLWAFLRLFSDQPSLFHAANVVLHALNTALVVLVIRRLLAYGETPVRRPMLLPALVGGCLFALHPFQCETVAWVSGLRDLSSASFLLLSIVIFVAPAVRCPTHFVWAFVSFVLSLLCKPSAVILPVALLCLNQVYMRRTAKDSLRFLAPWFAAAIMVAVATYMIQVETILPEQALMGFAQRCWVALDSLGFYLTRLVVPLFHAADYGRTPEVVLAQGSWLYPSIGATFVVICMVAMLSGRRSPVLGGLVFALVVMLPTSGIVSFAFQRISTVSDRYMYLPMMGFALALAALTRLMPTKVQVAALVLCLPLGLAAATQARSWSNDADFYQAMLANNPTSFSANSGLGTVALGRGELQKALGYYEVALAQQPINVLALANLGLALGHLGRFREVVERVAPFIPDEAQIKRNPLSALAIARMFEVVGFAQVQLGQVSAGLAAYLRARDLDPTNPAMAANVAALQAQEHSPTRASVPGEAAAKH